MSPSPTPCTQLISAHRGIQFRSMRWTMVDVGHAPHSPLTARVVDVRSRFPPVRPSRFAAVCKFEFAIYVISDVPSRFRYRNVLCGADCCLLTAAVRCASTPDARDTDRAGHSAGGHAPHARAQRPRARGARPRSASVCERASASTARIIRMQFGGIVSHSPFPSIYDTHTVYVRPQKCQK